jgi:hypothetical protein
MKGPPVSLEAAERLKAILRTRADNQFELDRLFSGNPKIRHQTRQKMEKLLRQSEAAETMAPSLQRDMPKTASIRPKGLTRAVKTASIAPNVDAWFEKNAHRFHTDAQNRYPELKKVARTLPGKCTKTVGTPVRSGLAGGSA